MSPSPWPLEQYRPLLRLQVRGMVLGRLARRFDESDVVQEALARAQTGIDQFRGASEPELIAWLQTVLASALKDLARRQQAGKRDVRREQQVDAAVGESAVRLEKMLTGNGEAPSAALHRADRAARLAAAIDRLDPDQRDAILLREMQGMPLADIAARLERTEKAVASLLFRARRRLRELLTDLAE
jgi:RNA polymerase sigma-70 factor, ECF subfamily